MRTASPFKWITNHLSYIQIYIFICSLFYLALLPIGYLWIETHLKDAQLVNIQLRQLDEENLFRRLYDLIQQHRFYSQLLADSKQDVRLEMETLQAQVLDTLQQLTGISQIDSKKSSRQLGLVWQQVDLDEISNKWNSLSHQVFQLSVPRNEILHTALINDLFIQFGYLADKLSLEFPEEADNFALVKGINIRLPFVQEHISQLLLAVDDAYQTNDSFLRDRILILTGFIQSDLSYLQHNTDLYINNPNLQAKYQTLLSSLSDYRSMTDRLLEMTNNRFNLTANNLSEITFSQIVSQAQLSLKRGSQLWQEGIEDLKDIFQNEKRLILLELWIAVGLTLLFLIVAFCVGLFITSKASSRLEQLTKATDSFYNGNLTVRIPVDYKDAMGRQGEAFNRMAQKLEEIVNHLYELLDATSALSNGDLSARIPVRNNGLEFDQVAQSFNRMAETFETIISRLQQIGLTLTTSANEIAAASKDQETIIVEQEATTREIAVAANEISSTAKEFAITMNDVSQVAEQTSHLALTGKDSLNNMETIMRQMVDASSNIALKLAVLNEKAGNITSVITTITKVADQTNLLSLNASIEAEKAGEYGKSFAVIAREIRRLADQTAIATLDIEKIVDEIMTAVSSSVMGVDDFTQEIRHGVGQVRTVSEQLARIITQVQAFTERFESVNQGMQAQSTGAEQINESIMELSQTARQTSESIHQFHKTIQELNFAANQLRILTPFIHTNLKTADYPINKVASQTMQQFDQTMSSLHLATNKLKKLNTQTTGHRISPPEKDPPLK